MGALAGGVSGHSGHHHYIVTEDLYPLMREWAKRFGFTVPDQRWFAMNHKQLRMALEKTLESSDSVVIVDSLPYTYVLEEIQALVQGLLHRYEIPADNVISLDRVYGLEMACQHHLLETNRLTHLDNKTIDHVARPHSMPVDEQVDKIIRNMNPPYRALVVDDGIWSGDSMRWVLSCLEKCSIKVKAVVVGVYIKRFGHTNDHLASLEKLSAVQTYERSRPVLDWVCERDFFVGTPLGGRTIANHEHDPGLQDWQSVGAFYSTNETWLKDWASINSNPRPFMNFCIDRSMAIFAEIRELSRRPVLMQHLERLPIQAIEENVSLDTPVCKYLERLLV